MGAKHRHVKHLSGKYVGSPLATADDGGSGTISTAVRALCTAQTKFHDAVPLSRIADAGSLGRDQALVVHDI